MFFFGDFLVMEVSYSELLTYTYLMFFLIPCDCLTMHINQCI